MANKLILTILLLFTTNLLASDFDISIEGKDKNVIVTIFKNNDKYKIITTYEELSKYLKGQPNLINEYVKEIARGN